MTKSNRLKWFLLLSPIFVLMFARISIETANIFFDGSYYRILSLAGYYLSILIIMFMARIFFSLKMKQIVYLTFHPYPVFWTFVCAIIIPLILILHLFIPQLKYIPFEFPIYFGIVARNYVHIYKRMLSFDINNRPIKVGS